VFACCAYIRVLHDYLEVAKGEKKCAKVTLSLITVTPTKTESVSRLELAACEIATRIGNAVANSCKINASKINYWIDSMNCVYWINTPSPMTKTFVANRVG
jgi:hypothetical protein